MACDNSLRDFLWPPTMGLTVIQGCLQGKASRRQRRDAGVGSLFDLGSTSGSPKCKQAERAPKQGTASTQGPLLQEPASIEDMCTNMYIYIYYVYVYMYVCTTYRHEKYNYQPAYTSGGGPNPPFVAVHPL